MLTSIVVGTKKVGSRLSQPRVPDTVARHDVVTAEELNSWATAPSSRDHCIATVRSTPVGARSPVTWSRSGAPQEQPRERRGVDAEVEQGAAAVVAVEQPVCGVVVEGKGEVGLD